MNSRIQNINLTGRMNKAGKGDIRRERQITITQKILDELVQKEFERVKKSLKNVRLLTTQKDNAEERICVSRHGIIVTA